MTDRRSGDAADSDAQNNRAQSFELSVGSRRLRVTGGATLMILVLAVALGYVIWTTQGATKQSAVEHATMTKELHEFREESTYIMTLDQKERDVLRSKLAVPERLRHNARREEIPP